MSALGDFFYNWTKVIEERDERIAKEKFNWGESIIHAIFCLIFCSWPFLLLYLCYLKEMGTI